MQRYWVCTRTGDQLGPFTSGELRASAEAGRIGPDDQISLDRSRWTRAGDVRGLSFQTAPLAATKSESDELDYRIAALGGERHSSEPAMSNPMIRSVTDRVPSDAIGAGTSSITLADARTKTIAACGALMVFLMLAIALLLCAIRWHDESMQLANVAGVASLIVIGGGVAASIFAYRGSRNVVVIDNEDESSLRIRVQQFIGFIKTREREAIAQVGATRVVLRAVAGGRSKAQVDRTFTLMMIVGLCMAVLPGLLVLVSWSIQRSAAGENPHRIILELQQPGQSGFLIASAEVKDYSSLRIDTPVVMERIKRRLVMRVPLSLLEG